MLGKKYLTSFEMREVVIYTKEPVSTKEDTERLEKIFDSNYAKAKLEQVAANAIHMNAEDRTKLLRLLQYFEDLLDGTLGDWETEPTNL